MSEVAQQILLLFDRGERAKAERILRNMGVEALPVLRELLERPLRAGKKSRALYWLLPMLATPFLLFALFGPPEYEGGAGWSWHEGMTPMSSTNTWVEWIFTYLFFCIMPGLFVTIGFNALLSRSYQGSARTQPQAQAQNLAAQTLTQIKDVRAVGLLLEIVCWLEERLPAATLNAGREALIRLLPDLTQETALSLTLDQRRALLNLLESHSRFVTQLVTEETTPRGIPSSPYDVPLSLAILHVYTLVGDPKALWCVERLTNASVRTHTTPEGNRINNPSPQKVIDKARSALPKLRANCEALRTGESLLRAASKPAAAPEELLRPSQGSQETPPDQLLRAGLGHSDIS